MANETANFREMGYENMGMDKRGSIGGELRTKATSTDVNRDKSSLTSYGLHGSKAKRSSGRKMGKKRK